jgi:transcriptional regulator with XRE-family HTH domain
MEPHIEPTGLARRLRQVRLDCYGENGAPELALALGIPTRTWLNFERGVAPPAAVLLRLMALTGVEAAWLAAGRGAQFRAASGINRDRVPPIAR